MQALVHCVIARHFCFYNVTRISFPDYTTMPVLPENDDAVRETAADEANPDAEVSILHRYFMT